MQNRKMIQTNVCSVLEENNKIDPGQADRHETEPNIEEIDTQKSIEFLVRYDHHYSGWCVFQQGQARSTLALRRSNARNTQQEAEALILMWDQQLSAGLVPQYEV